MTIDGNPLVLGVFEFSAAGKPQRLVFRFDPDSITRSRTVSVQQSPVSDARGTTEGDAADRSGQTFPSKAAPRTLGLQFVLDDTSDSSGQDLQATGFEEALLSLQRLVEPTNTKIASSEFPLERTPIAVFSWGARAWRVQVTQLSVNSTRFTSDGRRSRVEVDISMTVLDTSPTIGSTSGATDAGGEVAIQLAHSGNGGDAMNSNDLTALQQRLAALERRSIGLYRAFVVDNADPLGRGRLQLLVPEVLGDLTTGWAEPCMSWAGRADLGSYTVPSVTKDADGKPTTGVWVQFRSGDVRFPVWVGTFWGVPFDPTSSLGALRATALEPQAGSWSELVLPMGSLLRLDTLVSQHQGRSTVFGTWGLRSGSCTQPGITALFHGPPGTSKTFAASLLAGRLGCDIYRVDLATITSGHSGGTEENLRRIFDAAKTSNALLFFDEADALFPERTAVSESSDRRADLQHALLHLIESFDGVAIVATHFKTHIDQAFLRHMDVVVEFPFPDTEQRRILWATLLPDGAGLSLDEGDLAMLASSSLAGGGIRDAIQTGLFLAAGHREPPSVVHLLSGLRTVLEGLGRPIPCSAFERHGAAVALLEQLERWRVLVDGAVDLAELRAIADAAPLNDADFMPALRLARGLDTSTELDGATLALGVCARLEDAGRLARLATSTTVGAPEELHASDPAGLRAHALSRVGEGVRQRYLERREHAEGHAS